MANLTSLLRGEAIADWPDAVYYRYWEHDDPIHSAPAHYGIRTTTHKLICYYGAGLDVPGASDRLFETEWELYDLVADPDEQTNIAVDPDAATVRADLERRLYDLMTHYQDVPYVGPETPHPDWGPADLTIFERIEKYVASIRASGGAD